MIIPPITRKQHDPKYEEQPREAFRIANNIKSGLLCTYANLVPGFAYWVLSCMWCSYCLWFLKYLNLAPDPLRPYILHTRTYTLRLINILHTSLSSIIISRAIYHLPKDLLSHPTNYKLQTRYPASHQWRFTPSLSSTMQSSKTPSAPASPITTSWIRSAIASIGSLFNPSSKEDESESDAISGWVGARRRRCRSVGEARWESTIWLFG